MRIIAIFVSVIMLGGCVSGAPKLTAEQSEKLKRIEVLNSEQTTDKPYTVLQDISAADCSGAPYGGRVWGDAEKAIDTLKAKAAVLDADAIIKTKCSAAPLVNNCWAAKVCSGTAVKW